MKGRRPEVAAPVSGPPSIARITIKRLRRDAERRRNFNGCKQKNTTSSLTTSSPLGPLRVFGRFPRTGPIPEWEQVPNGSGKKVPEWERRHDAPSPTHTAQPPYPGFFHLPLSTTVTSCGFDWTTADNMPPPPSCLPIISFHLLALLNPRPLASKCDAPDAAAPLLHINPYLALFLNTFPC